jgi:hypothetical protein
MNFQAMNTGNIYLIDARIRLQLPALNGIDIADKINNKPNYVGYSFVGRVGKPEKPPYPTVTRAKGKYIIDQKMGDIKHYQDTLLFVNPIRVWASPFSDRHQLRGPGDYLRRKSANAHQSNYCSILSLVADYQ